MRARGGEPDDGIPGARTAAVDDPVTLDDTDAETSKVVIAFRVHAGHFCGLAADECTARFDATFGDARDDALGHVDREPAGRVVVEEEERLGALDYDIIRAHRDEILSDTIVASGVDREPELGADAVRPGDENWPTPAALGYLDHRAEAADACENLGPVRARDARLDALDQFLAGIDVDAGIPVGQRGAFSHRGNPGWVRQARPAGGVLL